MARYIEPQIPKKILYKPIFGDSPAAKLIGNPTVSGMVEEMRKGGVWLTDQLTKHFPERDLGVGIDLYKGSYIIGEMTRDEGILEIAADILLLWYDKDDLSPLIETIYEYYNTHRDI